MKALLLLLITAVALTSFGQKQIKLEEVKNHIGDSVRVGGNIYGIKVFEDDNKKPTLAFINLGADSPNQLLTIAVYPEGFKNTDWAFPDERFKGDFATVTGKVELYKGKPQIVVRSPEFLGIVATGPVVIPKQ